MKRGKLTTVTGPMFAGKSKILIEIYDSGANTVVFKPSIDTRYTNRPALVSKTNEEIPSVMVSPKDPDEMLELVDGSRRVIIDEANLFSQKLVETVTSLLKMGKQVFVGGLSLDSERVAWGPMNELIKLADEKVVLTARCDGENCSKVATLSYRKIPKTEQVKVGGVDEYGAACEDHYKILHHKPNGNV